MWIADWGKPVVLSIFQWKWTDTIYFYLKIEAMRTIFWYLNTYILESGVLSSLTDNTVQGIRMAELLENVFKEDNEVIMFSKAIFIHIK